MKDIDHLPKIYMCVDFKKVYGYSGCTIVRLFMRFRRHCIVKNMTNVFKHFVRLMMYNVTVVAVLPEGSTEKELLKIESVHNAYFQYVCHVNKFTNLNRELNKELEIQVKIFFSLN